MARLELQVTTPGAQEAISALGALSEAERKVVLEAARHGAAAGTVAAALKGLSPAAVAAAQAIGALSEAERKGATEAGKLQGKLDDAARKAEELGKKSSLVGQLGTALGEAGDKLVALAGPTAIFGALIANAKSDVEAMLARAEKAKSGNLSYAQASAQLFRNDPTLKEDPKLQNDFDALFRTEGLKYEGLTAKLPTALADVRSSTSTLAIAKDPEALKAAVSEAASLHAAYLGTTDVAADINSMLQIADRDTRQIPASQKVMAASATLAAFQGASAGSADDAAKILPRALPALQFLGSRDNALSLQAFATNQGLTQEAALGALQPMQASLRGLEKDGTVLDGANDYEKILSAAKLAKAGKISIADFAGGNQSAATVFQALVNDPNVLTAMKADLGKASETTTSSAAGNRLAQSRQNPLYSPLLKESESKAAAEVAALSNTVEAKEASRIASVRSKIEAIGGDSVLTGGRALNKLVISQGAARLTGRSENDVAADQESFLMQRLADGLGKDDTSVSLRGRSGLVRAKSNDDYAADIRANTLAGKGVSAEDGIDILEAERLRFSGANEGQIAALQRVDPGSEAQKNLLADILKALKDQKPTQPQIVIKKVSL